MKNVLKVNHNDRTIIMDKTFAKYASVVGSDEYIKLQGARSDYPTYQIVTRTIKKNPAKESYRGLTYKYMEEYIALHENAESNLAHYNELRLIAKCHTVRYAHIKAWFLSTYPEVVKFGLLHTSAEKANDTSITPEINSVKIVDVQNTTQETGNAA